MKEFNYLVERNRMTKRCSINCIDCPLSFDNNGKGEVCTQFEVQYPHEATEIVRKWASEQPEKTKGDHFKELFPNCKTSHHGIPKVCPATLNTNFYCWNDKSCKKCERDYFSQPYEEGEEGEQQCIL